MHLKVREAEPQDGGGIDEVEASATAVLRRIYRPRRDSQLVRIATPEGQVRLVAELIGQIIGTVRYMEQEGAIELYGLGVHHEHRQQGVASALIYQVETVAGEKNIPAVQLHTVKETGNYKIFEKLGFETVEEKPDPTLESDQFGSLTDILMVKNL